MRKNKEDLKEYGDNYDNPERFTDIFSNKKKMKFKKRWIDITVSILSLASLVFGSALIYMDSMLNKINYEKPTDQLVTEIDNKPGLVSKDIFNISVFGINGGLSDVNMIVSLDSKHNKIKLISLLRDIYLNIPGHGDNRLNTAYAKGKGNLASQTIQTNFGIKLDGTFAFDFNAFEKFIDAIGGINQDLTKAERQYINYFSKDVNTLPLEDGDVHLNGKQALCHSRNRTLPLGSKNYKKDNEKGTDYDRTARQKAVTKEIIKKSKSINPGQIMDIANKVLPEVTTNMTKANIQSLIFKLPVYSTYSVEEFHLPTSDNMKNNVEIRGMRVEVIPNWEKARRDLAKFIYEDESN